jgi:hypothetical protein
MRKVSQSLNLFDRLTVRLFDCLTVRLFDCSTVRLFDCSTVRLFDCLTVLLFVLLSFCATPLQAQPDFMRMGHFAVFDGNYYDFRDGDGVQMIKLWVPPGVDVVRGVFISGHGGGGGDSRNFARDENMRAMAMRLGFGIAGLHNFPGGRAYEIGAAVFFYALEEFAKLGHHPELAHVPFVMYGSSNGGSATYGFVNYAPERAICFVSNVAGGGNPQPPVDAALQVPGMFIIGKYDALTGQRGMESTQRMMAYARPKGARWAWALELKGHEDGYSFDVYMKLVEQAVALRYPEHLNPANGPVTLEDIPEREGWLVDMDSWESGFTYVDDYANYRGDKQLAGWVLNKDMAYVYRSLATHHNPARVTVREFDRTFNPNINPGTMFSLGGPVATPGDSITIRVDVNDMGGMGGMTPVGNWIKAEIYNGSVKLGDILPGSSQELRILPDPAPLVYCLVAVVTAENGARYTSPPMHFFMKNPYLSPAPKETRKVFTGIKTNSGSRNLSGQGSATQPNPADSVLVAYALTGDQESQFTAFPKTISPFWQTISERQLDHISMSARSHGSRDATFNPVITHDCNMTVWAAYGADGLYLLFDINDDNDVPWPNEWTGTANEQFYIHYDAVDVLIDGHSIKEITDPENKHWFLSRSFALTHTTRQYQVASGTRQEKPTGFVRSTPDPWDMHGRFVTFEEAEKFHGIQIKLVKTKPFHKAQEWFIPWQEIGHGLREEPPAGTRFAFTAGFNDRDAGEHMEPGVTSSGGSIKASNAIRWIGRTDPWSSGPANGTPPYAWGEIELGYGAGY